MKRPLTEQETELTKKGIKNREKRLKENKIELDYLNDFEEFNKRWSTYLENKEKKSKDNKERMMIMARKQLTEEIKIDEDALKQEKSQLKHGVEVKKMTGVN